MTQATATHQLRPLPHDHSTPRHRVSALYARTGCDGLTEAACGGPVQACGSCGPWHAVQVSVRPQSLAGTWALGEASVTTGAWPLPAAGSCSLQPRLRLRLWVCAVRPWGVWPSHGTGVGLGLPAAAARCCRHRARLACPGLLGWWAPHGGEAASRHSWPAAVAMAAAHCVTPTQARHHHRRRRRRPMPRRWPRAASASPSRCCGEAWRPECKPVRTGVCTLASQSCGIGRGEQWHSCRL